MQFSFFCLPFINIILISILSAKSRSSRSTWDYQYAVDKFVAKLEHIAQFAPVFSSPKLVRYNSTKRYLQDFANKGIKTVPTIWYDEPPKYADLLLAFDSFKTDKLVVKPQIGAGSESTYILKRGSIIETEWKKIEEEYSRRKGDALKSVMIQPFRGEPLFPHRSTRVSEIYVFMMISLCLGNIQTEGEYSTLFFGDRFSHVILKTPKVRSFSDLKEIASCSMKLTRVERRLQSSRHLWRLHRSSEE